MYLLPDGIKTLSPGVYWAKRDNDGSWRFIVRVTGKEPFLQVVFVGDVTGRTKDMMEANKTVILIGDKIVVPDQNWDPK